jgi:cysteinyl-tRNA synthetase
MRLHNSLTGQVEEFVPLEPQRVTMYVCGPTVYDTPHVGNARPLVVFDLLYRLLRDEFATVRYARNITDIDDKIMDRAKENGEHIGALTQRTTADYHAIAKTLGCLPPTHEPRATHNVGAMLAMISVLIKNGYAYVAEGHVLFNSAKRGNVYPLTGHDPDNLREGHRVAVEPYKREGADFVLWKPSEPDQPGWESPWGRGRPGWHIECSAMIRELMGVTIDIHGGGNDLRFPHHEAEIAQSECTHNAPLARYWVHNGMLLLNGRKMAKSTGNFFTVRQILDGTAFGEKFTGQEIRLALMQTHYRHPLDLTLSALDNARKSLDRWFGALLPHREWWHSIASFPEPNLAMDSLRDDMNTPEAIMHLHEMATRINRDQTHPGADVRAMVRACFTMGLLPNVTHRNANLLTPEAKSLLDQRIAARKYGDYNLADKLREELRSKARIEVKDTKAGQLWYHSGIADE